MYQPCVRRPSALVGRCPDPARPFFSLSLYISSRLLPIRHAEISHPVGISSITPPFPGFFSLSSVFVCCTRSLPYYYNMGSGYVYIIRPVSRIVRLNTHACFRGKKIKKKNNTVTAAKLCGQLLRPASVLYTNVSGSGESDRQSHHNPLTKYVFHRLAPFASSSVFACIYESHFISAGKNKERKLVEKINR